MRLEVQTHSGPHLLLQKSGAMHKRVVCSSVASELLAAYRPWIVLMRLRIACLAAYMLED